MTSNMIIFIVFAAILAFLISGLIGMGIMASKGRSTKVGFFVGLLPIVGHVAMLFVPQSDKFLAEELLNRKLISQEDYEKTMQVILKK